MSLALFSFVSSITPGPNNLMLMASGTNFGFRRTIPHMLGISIGFGVMIFLVGLGIAALFKQFPAAYIALKVVSVVYMLWLAYRIATASAPNAKNLDARPMTFIQAALFQWVNPKAWSMTLTAVALYSPAHDLHSLLIITVIFVVVNLPSVSCWAWLGQNLRRWLSSPVRLRAFNFGMAFLLVCSMALML